MDTRFSSARTSTMRINIVPLEINIIQVRRPLCHGCTTIRRKPFRRYDKWSHTTFRQVRHLVEKNSQVRHSVEIVKPLFFDQTSYSTERRIHQMLLIIKKENHKKSLCLPDVQLIKACSSNFIKLLQR